MVAFDSETTRNGDHRILDAEATREELDHLLERGFNPEALRREPLHPIETARFIAEQARKLRLAALRSGSHRLIWMIENLYYEAYSVGCAPEHSTCSKKMADSPRGRR